ncbi:hypothetical protein [Neobacillus ginsengisoli]|uniref:hypothetical protein n=1 Tax=Neobacillus ginsengisoli TaxID=904295 RepID=UPI0027D81C06|nr:hypothetical protein [Neobacillus ginsengisoli]
MIGVESDHVVIENENNYIFYYSIDKIQAVTKNTKQFQGEEIATTFQKTQSLTELLESFKNCWISILTLNKQRFSGVLSDIDPDFVTLINGEERILIKLTHISNILKGFIKEEEKKPEPKKENGQDNNQGKNSENGNKENSENTMKNQSENKSKSSTNEDSKSSETKSTSSEKKETTVSAQQEEVYSEAIKDEPIQTNVWSHSIKMEAEKTNEESSEQTKSVVVPTTEVTAPKVQPSTKKQTSVNYQNNTKTEEPKELKEKQMTSSKEIKQEKEEVKKETMEPKLNKEVKVETKKENFSEVTKKEVKSETKKETNVTIEKEVKVFKPLEPLTFANSVRDNSQNQSLRKPTNTRQETDQKNKQETNQIEQEVKQFRFAGEPVARDRDNERAFPFAGWPNNRRKSQTRFKSFDNFF